MIGRTGPSRPVGIVRKGIIEAAGMDEAVRLVAGTPCARAQGAVELRPIAMMNLPEWSERGERIHPDAPPPPVGIE
jgi:hypothetical protein